MSVDLPLYAAHHTTMEGGTALQTRKTFQGDLETISLGASLPRLTPLKQSANRFVSNTATCPAIAAMIMRFEHVSRRADQIKAQHEIGCS